MFLKTIAHGEEEFVVAAIQEKRLMLASWYWRIDTGNVNSYRLNICLDDAIMPAAAGAEESALSGLAAAPTDDYLADTIQDLSATTFRLYSRMLAKKPCPSDETPRGAQRKKKSY
jgi:hypothetical protein